MKKITAQSEGQWMSIPSRGHLVREMDAQRNHAQGVDGHTRRERGAWSCGGLACQPHGTPAHEA